MKIVIVGASGTIGSAVTDLLSQHHEVVRASRSAEVRVDITDSGSIRAMYDTVGAVDAVVSCAGGGAMKSLTELTDDEFEGTLHNKVMGQVNLVRFGLDAMNDGGVFILTSGIFSKKPMPGVTDMALANGAIESFVRGAALDLPRTIRINAVSPPFIKETAEKMGMDGGLPATTNAEAYRDLIDGTDTGEVVFTG
jgi:NAD(P)-dependent dehydrogenase (short-subunit alcohol dehydrogenase family)